MILLSSLGKYNKHYEESDIDTEIVALNRKIQRLKKKRSLMKDFGKFGKFGSFWKEGVSFQEILGIELYDNWSNFSQVGMEVNTSEEVYFFKVMTDQSKFKILFEYLGSDWGVKKDIYHLHTPYMSEREIDEVERMVREYFNDYEDMVISHMHKPYEGERAFIGKVKEIRTCKKEYVKSLSGSDVCLFRKGEKYIALEGKKTMKVETEQGDNIFLTHKVFGEYFK